MSMEQFATQLPAIIKIQALFRGFLSRRRATYNSFKINKTEELEKVSEFAYELIEVAEEAEDEMDEEVAIKVKPVHEEINSQVEKYKDEMAAGIEQIWAKLKS